LTEISGRDVLVPQSRLPVVAEPDVLLVGGGSAGLAAATAVARNGAKVMLVERFGYLGGLASGDRGVLE
jgi:ribulose 1,5-bisphosphate synthetase/thiazole synthase